MKNFFELSVVNVLGTSFLLVFGTPIVPMSTVAFFFACWFTWSSFQVLCVGFLWAARQLSSLFFKS